MTAQLSRRSLLASAAATTALAATASQAQSPMVRTVADLSGKSILITGSSTGFGRLMAEDFARKGAKVFATMRNLPRPEATELEALAAKEDLDITVIEIDVLDDAQVAAGVAEAERLAGGALDVLVNNAGVSIGGPVEIHDIEATHLVFDTNVYGPQRMARAALPKMRAARKGLIVNVTSQLGRLVAPGFGQYSGSKYALEAMSEQMAYELVPHGVDVTIIEPGGYPTMIWKNANTLALQLLERADDTHTSGYPSLVEPLGKRTGGGGSTDPMDVPDAISQVIASAPGTRPLRVEVHPGPKPQIAINQVSAKAQVGWLGNSPFGPWVKDVHNI